MSHSADTQLVPIEQVEKLIHLARGEKVLLDSDLVMLYGVSTGALNRAVQRNANRFPPDFMFQLAAEEAANLKCQFGTSSSGHGGRRRSLPYAFTDQGVAMLLAPPAKPHKQIGFHVKETRVPYRVKRMRP